jgi:hypothetical protein
MWFALTDVGTTLTTKSLHKRLHTPFIKPFTDQLVHKSMLKGQEFDLCGTIRTRVDWVVHQIPS